MAVREAATGALEIIGEPDNDNALGRLISAGGVAMCLKMTLLTTLPI